MGDFALALLRPLHALTRAWRHSLVVIVVLALGIGITTAIFSVFYGVLMRPLGYAEPESLVSLWEAQPERGWKENTTSLPNYEDFRRGSTSFEAMGIVTPWQVTLTGGDQPELADGFLVSAELFSSLGIAPIHGRVFSESEDQVGAGQVVVMGEGLWRRSFGADPELVGRSITVDGEPYTVVGIMPAGFRFPPPITFNGYTAEEGSELWSPVRPATEGLGRGSRMFLWFGRLAEGVSPDAAERELETIAEGLGELYPERNAGWTVDLNPLHEQVVSPMRESLTLLLAAGVLLLVILAANVAVLVLARASERSRDAAVQVALGAGRRHLVARSFLEALILCVAGGGVGLLLAIQLRSLILAFGGGSIPRVAEAQPLWPALLWGLPASLILATVLGALPAFLIGRVRLEGVLKEGGRSGSAGRGSRRLGRLLLAGEIAVALALLIGAGLVVSSYRNLRAVDPGFDAERVLTFNILMPEAKYPDPVARLQAVRRIEEGVAALPGVEAAGVSNILPLSGRNFNNSFAVPERPDPPDEEGYRAELRAVTPGYFDALGLPLEAGRSFGAADDRDARPVAVVNQALVDKYWPGGQAVGDQLAVGGRPGSGRVEGSEVAEIVGVVGDVRHFGPEMEAPPTLFVPMAQDPWNEVGVAVRSRQPARTLVPELRRVMAEIDPDLPLADVRTLETALDETVGQPRLRSAVLGALAVVALVLSVIGIYGVISYSVVRQAREIGVRMALGARGRDVRLAVLRRGLVPVVLGIAAGWGLAWFLARWLAGSLFGIEPFDPAVFLGVPAVLLVVALAALYLPARRASRVPPAVALRAE